jgi:hypothetical protein
MSTFGIYFPRTKFGLGMASCLDQATVIVVRAPYKKKAKLIFDGRLWHQGSEDPVCWIILSVTGKLVGKKNNISQLPRQNLGRKF